MHGDRWNNSGIDATNTERIFATRGLDGPRINRPAPKSQNEFEINQRSLAVGHAGDFPETALGVERARSGFGVESVQPDGICGKGAGLIDGFSEEATANA